MKFELLENGETVTKGGIGRALAGGILFGEAGAIVGGITGKKTTRKVVDTFKIKITINNIDNPIEYIELINKKQKLILVLMRKLTKMPIKFYQHYLLLHKALKRQTI